MTSSLDSSQCKQRGCRTLLEQKTKYVQQSLQKKLTNSQLEPIIAVRMIEAAWLSYKDREMFKLLKHALCAAERSQSIEILRKISPKEAELLADKFLQPKVRFRFSGLDFPPMIFFKIVLSVKNGAGVKYVNGNKMIKPASTAAEDACRRMGRRKFYDLVMEDLLNHRYHKITDEVDITTLKDYMQYSSLLDETPAYKGGRDNTWRKLTLEVLPRNTIFYDVVDYLYNGQMSSRLNGEEKLLRVSPITEELQMKHSRIISQTSSRSPDSSLVSSTRSQDQVQSQGHSERGSRKSKLRAEKMRKVYQSNRIPRCEDMGERNTDEEGEEEWERKANQLYEWTKQLSLDNPE